MRRGYARYLRKGDGAPPSVAPLLSLMPYLWPDGRRDLKTRVLISIFFLVLAKVVTVSVPFFFGRAVDMLDEDALALAIAVPIALVVSYGVARILMQAFAQIRDAVFAEVARTAFDAGDLQHISDRSRTGADRRHHAVLFRYMVCAGHTRHGRRLYAVHFRHHPLAHSYPPRDERKRYRCQHQGRRQPSQLRDGKVLQRRRT